MRNKPMAAMKLNEIQETVVLLIHYMPSSSDSNNGSGGVYLRGVLCIQKPALSFRKCQHLPIDVIFITSNIP